MEVVPDVRVVRSKLGSVSVEVEKVRSDHRVTETQRMNRGERVSNFSVYLCASVVASFQLIQSRLGFGDHVTKSGQFVESEQ